MITDEHIIGANIQVNGLKMSVDEHINKRTAVGDYYNWKVAEIKQAMDSEL